MRPPQCFIRYLKAASDAQAALLLSQYPTQVQRLTGFFTNVEDGRVMALVQDVLNTTAELGEHVRNCEECESP